MKRVLVTGADGFIGSHLTEELVKKGYKVKAFSFYNSFNTWGWLDTLPKDIMDHVESNKEKTRQGINNVKVVRVYGAVLFRDAFAGLSAEG